MGNGLKSCKLCRLYNMHNRHGLALYNLYNFQLLIPFPIFLQIWLDGSNYHIFPPYFAQMKWKIDGSSAHKHERTLQFFTFFPTIYSTYNGSARKKSSWIFSCARVRITASPFSPANMCIYIMVARRKRIWRLCWFVAAWIDYGHILPMVNVNSAQIGTDGVTQLWWNLRS